MLLFISQHGQVLTPPEVPVGAEQIQPSVNCWRLCSKPLLLPLHPRRRDLSCRVAPRGRPAAGPPLPPYAEGLHPSGPCAVKSQEDG